MLNRKLKAACSKFCRGKSRKPTAGDSDPCHLRVKLLLWLSVARGPGASLVLELGGKVETPLAWLEPTTGVPFPPSTCLGLKAGRR